MSKSLSAMVASVSRALVPPETTDAQLVGRFVRDRDGDAFAALVHRHGPMVLAVCRRVSGDAHLADDAFQATFLVLARRAADVKPREAVRSWLYGVAVRTAREARAMSARRRSREVPVPAVPDRAAVMEPAADADTLLALDEEIARLPDHLRAVVVLCELDGLSRKDAAERLGIPEGTLSSRLAKARKLLAERLRGRGVAAVSLAALVERSTAGVPTALANAATALVGPGPVPAGVAELSRGVFRTMLLSKLKVLTAGAAIFAAVVGSTALVIRQATATAAPLAAPRTTTAPEPKADAGKIVVWNQGEPILINPDGTGKTKLPAPPEWKDEKGVGMCRLSPDGSRLLVVPRDTWPKDGSPIKAYVRGLTDRGAGEVVRIGGKTHRLFWTPDGAICGEGIDPTQAGKRKATSDEEFSAWRYDPKTKTATRIPKEEDFKGIDRLLDAFPDGKRFLIHRPSQNQTAEPQPSPLRVLDESGQTKLIPTAGFSGWGWRLSETIPRVSPDGKTILYSAMSTDQRIQGQLPYDLFVLDVAGGEPKQLELKELGLAMILSCCWSPDGKRVALTWFSKSDVKWKYPQIPDPPMRAQLVPVPKVWDFTNVKTHLTVADADGKNLKTILTVTGRWIGTVDWRSNTAPPVQVPNGPDTPTPIPDAAPPGDEQPAPTGPIPPSPPTPPVPTGEGAGAPAPDPTAPDLPPMPKDVGPQDRPSTPPLEAKKPRPEPQPIVLSGRLVRPVKWSPQLELIPAGQIKQIDLVSSDLLRDIKDGTPIRVVGVVRSRLHRGGTKDNPSPFPAQWIIELEVTKVEVLDHPLDVLKENDKR